MVDTERTETLLALLLLQQMKSASQQDKIVQLNIAGFSNLEIANILQTTPPVVAQSVYAGRKRGAGKSRKRSKKAAKKSKRKSRGR